MATQKDKNSHNSKSNSKMKELLNNLDKIREGNVVTGKVVQIKGETVLVDVGLKTEGVLKKGEVTDPSGKLKVKVGDELEVFLEKRGDAFGRPVISFKKAEMVKTWDRIRDAYTTQKEIPGKIVKKVKGGMRVDLGGPVSIPKEGKGLAEAFMPASQVGYPPVKDLDSIIGQVVPLRIIEFKAKKNIVVSWRLVIEDEVKKKREELLNRINVGDVLKGTVKNITKFGAFIDLGGIDGLLHIGDITWGRLEKVEDALKVGEQLDVKVLSFNQEKEQISLGLKQLEPHPWENIGEKYAVDSTPTGKVTGILPYGAFVELEPGIEGLIHVSEMSWTGKIKHPCEVLKAGDMVKVRVLNIDEENRRLSLGLKQVQANPWAQAKEKYPPGTRLTGTVTHLAPFGAFVRLEEGIEGMIHVSDISWTMRLKHPGQVLKEGDRVEAVVLDINVEAEKISLGLKQKSKNPYDKYLVGSNVQGKVVHLTNFGAFVELEPGIEGLIHISQVAKRRVKDIRDVLKVGDKVWAKITKADPRQMIINLSIKEYIKTQERVEMEKYIEQEIPEATLGEIISEKLDNPENEK
ncbi:MAG: 30S ribosomal protein S1 [bacterium]